MARLSLPSVKLGGRTVVRRISRVALAAAILLAVSGTFYAAGRFTDWEAAQRIAGTIQSLTAAVGVIAAGSWAYYRFVRHRTLEPRVAFGFQWDIANDFAARCVAVLTVKLVNKGLTKIALRKAGNPRCYLKYSLISNAPTGPMTVLTVPSKHLDDLDTLFVSHGWIEPGETIDDIHVLSIDRTGLAAVQFEAVVYGKRKWSASCAFPLIGESAAQRTLSEDEQDDYSESEACEQGLKTILTKVSRLMPEQSAQFNALVAAVESALQQEKDEEAFVKCATRLIRQAHQLFESLRS